MQHLAPNESSLCTTGALPRPGMFRRLAAVAYDGLILLGLWLLAALIFVLVADTLGQHAWPRWLFQAYLWFVGYGFFGWFWLHGGQTLGMRVWRLKLVADGSPMSWSLALRRFSAATVSFVLFGAGFFWMLVDPQRRTWHDHASRTHLVLMPRVSARAVEQKERQPEETQRGERSAEERGQAMEQTEKAEAPVHHKKGEPEHHAGK